MQIDVMVTTAGGIEEDLIKCLAPTYKGDFSLPGASLSSKGLNRIGNLLVPNDNYCKFEDWITPILDKMLEEQQSSKVRNIFLPIDPQLYVCYQINHTTFSPLFNLKKVLWTPSKLIARLGKEINDENSYLYWAYKVIQQFFS